jgi:hypothetical protein
MSLDVHIRVIVGSVVRQDLFFQEVSERADCGHAVRTGDKFCSECGSSVRYFTHLELKPEIKPLLNEDARSSLSRKVDVYHFEEEFTIAGLNLLKLRSGVVDSYTPLVFGLTVFMSKSHQIDQFTDAKAGIDHEAISSTKSTCFEALSRLGMTSTTAKNFVLHQARVKLFAIPYITR